MAIERDARRAAAADPAPGSSNKTGWAIAVLLCACLSTVVGISCCKDGWALVGVLATLIAFTVGVVLLADWLHRRGSKLLECSMIAGIVIRLLVEPVMTVDLTLGFAALTIVTDLADGTDVRGFFAASAVVLVCGTLNLVCAFAVGLPFGALWFAARRHDERRRWRRFQSPS